MGLADTRLSSLRGTSVVGRTNVNIEITDQDHYCVLMELFHLKQFVYLHDELGMTERMLSMNKMVNLKSEGTPKRRPTFESDGTSMCTPDSKFVCTPIGKPHLKSEGTPLDTLSNKSDVTQCRTTDSGFEGPVTVTSNHANWKLKSTPSLSAHQLAHPTSRLSAH